MKRSLLALILMFALAVVVGGCAQKTTQRGATGSQTPLLATYQDSQALGARIQWQIDLGLEARANIKRITPIGEYLVVLEAGNILSLIDDGTGLVRWRRAIGSPLDRFTKPLIRDEQVIICSESRLFALRLDNGELDRTFNLEHNGATDPHILHGFIIFGSPDGLVFAQSLRGGYLVWRYKMSSGITTNPLAVPSSMFVTDERGQVATINASSGQVVWRRAKPPWATITAQPAALGGMAYTASHDQKLYAFDRASGNIIWQYLTEAPLTVAPAILGERLYLHTQDRGLVCLDTLSGEEYWRADLKGTPAHLKGSVIKLVEGGTIHRVDAKRGELIDSIELPDADLIHFESDTGGDLYLVNRAGRIMKLAMQ